MDGAREFMPDWGPALRQLPLLSWLPAIPRPGTAMMVGTFYRMALLRTAGAPELAERRPGTCARFDGT